MKKILVIDDEKDVRDMLVDRLESEDYEVIQAKDGAEGLEITQAEKPDLILLDILMPNVNGYHYIREMRSLEEIRDIPVIVLTAKEKMEELFKVEGAREYIIKPFNADDLLKAIKKQFNN